MQKELTTSNGHIFFYTIFCINFSILDRQEHSTLQKCYLFENKLKGKEKVSNINAARIDTIKTCAEN